MWTAALDRRAFLRRTGLLGAALALAQVPDILRANGLLDPAYAQEPDLVRDTINGLVAFVVPGPDDYSVAQGVSTEEPGGIDAGATDFMIASLDNFVPMPDQPSSNDDTMQLSPGIANLLNVVAVTVNPVAAGGAFLSPFARLSFAEKAAVFERIETSDVPDGSAPQPFTQASGNLKFVAGALLEFVAFGTYSEYAVFDPESRELTARPVGWDLTGFQPDGPVEGWDEFVGYWEGRREVSG